MSGCQLVVEAVFENLEVKKSVFEQLDRVCDARCLLCSNTSSLDVDVIASAVQEPRRRERVLGMHFFSPAHIMRLVEVVVGHCTSRAACEVIMAITKRIRKLAVAVANLPGFVGNRMVFPYVLESMMLLEDGCSVQQVDDAIRSFGFLMGPFQMSDLSGLDIGFSVRKEQGMIDKSGAVVSSSSSSSSSLWTSRYCEVADELYRLGRLGVKSGKGFYDYAAEEKTEMAKQKKQSGVPRGRPDAAVDDVLRQLRDRKGIVPRSDISSKEIVERALFPLVNEGFKILGDGGVISHRPGDIDVVYLNGYAWPRHKGGPLFYADRVVGLSHLLHRLRELHGQYAQSEYFRPALLLERMVQRRVSVMDLQREPQLVRTLMEEGHGLHKSKL